MRHLSFLLLILPLLCQAQIASPAPSMNGLNLKDYKDFEKNWKQVTVRYRKDSGEMRFTYANPLAWETLQAGKTDFPDGAMFAKMGFSTVPDSLFVSSAVPGAVNRVQLMLKDKKKFAETSGWGYAVFDGAGEPFPGEVKSLTLACAACHQLADSRGQVFS